MKCNPDAGIDPKNVLFLSPARLQSTPIFDMIIGLRADLIISLQGAKISAKATETDQLPALAYQAEAGFLLPGLSH